MIKSDDFLAEANSIKVLVLMEVEPLTDRFEQIMFTTAQAKKLRDTIVTILHPEYDLAKEDDFAVPINDDVAVSLPNVLDEYDLKEVQEALS